MLLRTISALGAVAVVLVLNPYDAFADDKTFLSSGNRLLVQTEGRKDYSPRIVVCDSAATGLCLRDTRGTPQNNPIDTADGGDLRVTFESWGISYVISPDGSGKTFDAGGKALAPFKWSMVAE